MKVLQVLGSLDLGGAESRMMDVFRNIDRSKYEFTFLTMMEGKQFYEDEIISLGGKIIKIDPPRKSGAFKNYKELIKVMKNERFDVVHSHTSFHSGVVMLAAKNAKVPIRIAHSRTTGTDNKSFKNRVSLKLGRMLISLCSTKKFAISKEAGNYLFADKDFTVLPNAINCEKYYATEETTVNDLKDHYGIQKGSICIGLVGRFYEMKNHKFALDIFREYHEKNRDSYLIFVGDGPERTNIEGAVQKQNLSSNVIFTGVQTNVNEWMKLFDVLLVPSIFEGLGGVILEAQAAGTPVIKSDTFTDEADMKIGLVRKLPINNGVNEWVDAIDEMRNAEKPGKGIVQTAFDERGYSLLSEIEILTKTYEEKK